MRKSRIYYDIHDVRAVCEVARSGSFRDAAQALSITTSALSRRIAKLEEAIDGLLVRRTTRAVGLTPLGRRLVARAEPLVQELDECIHESARMAKGMEGQISIGCVSSMAFGLIASAVAEFRRRNPNLRLSMKDATGAEITISVLQHELVMGITSTLGGRHPDLHVERVASDPFVLVVPKSHPLGKRRSLRWADIDGLRLLGYRASSPLRAMLDKRLEAEGIELDWFDEIATLSSQLSYLQTGAFASVVPLLFARHLTALRTIPLTGPRIERDIFLIRRRDQELIAPARQFWDDIRNQIVAQTRDLSY